MLEEGNILKIVLAPDSYKGSLPSSKVSEIMKKAIQTVDDQTETTLKPMADGGEGTLEAFSKAVSHEKVAFMCTGPLGEKRESWYIKLNEDQAVIEGAIISGLPLVPEAKRNPDHTTSFGIGEAILYALDQGIRDLLIAIGGSSTNDGGLGMLQALGMKAYDSQGKNVGIYGKDVATIHDVDFSTLDPRLETVTIRVASDVDNPLTGPKGASHIYGPQKGATSEQITKYDQALASYGHLVEKACNKTIADLPGAGAAGGLGLAFLAIGGRLESGAKLVGEAIQLPEAIRDADLVITGEGQSDEQTMYGKAPGYVSEIANQYNKPVILISGSLGAGYESLDQVFTGCFSTVPAPTSLENCLENAEENLYQTTKQVVRLIYAK
jgi:glycerate 2-kinase